jgi:hypothetical protein
MRPNPFRYILLILILIILFSASSCVPGRRTAQNFIARSNEFSVMIIPPTQVFLYHFPYENPDHAPENLEDSQLLNGIDSSQTIRLFMESLQQELLNLNMKVFAPDDFDSFLQQIGPRFIFSVAQSEIIEVDRIFTDRVFIDSLIYRQDFLIRALEQNTWFEFVKVNEIAADSEMQVLYSSFDVADRINGRFRYNRNWEVYYEYQSELLTQEDVYNLNRFAGRRNGRYIFEFLLNLAVEEKHGPQPRGDYFKYVPSTGEVTRSRDNMRFIILDPEEILIED